MVWVVTGTKEESRVISRVVRGVIQVRYHQPNLLSLVSGGPCEFHILFVCDVCLLFLFLYWNEVILNLSRLVL